MAWLGKVLRSRRSEVSEDERRRLEDWVRLRLQLDDRDPMAVLIGAVGRLMGAGMDAEAAVATALRINDELNRRSTAG